MVPMQGNSLLLTAALAVVALIYLTMTITLSLVLRHLETRLRGKSER